MIEMVYRGTSKDGKGKERTGLPKNIRQIGDAGSDKRVYIEDYVITFLEKTGCAVLLGEVWQNENMKCLFAGRSRRDLQRVNQTMICGRKSTGK